MNRFIIDGFNLVFRSHFAFKNFTTSTGLSSGGVYGTLMALKSLRKRFSDCKFYVAWDNNAVRKKTLFADYKANRPPFRLDSPVKDLKEALKSVCINQVEVDFQEADDVIASLVKNSCDGIDYVYSNDKDMLQLVKDGRVIVLSPKVGPTPEKFYDEEAVRGKFGVSPDKVACYLSLRGDTSDNIPGAVRVPSKIIANLCNKYGTIENIFSNLDAEQLTDFQRHSLLQARSQLFINKELIYFDSDLTYYITEGSSNLESFKEFLHKYEIKKLDAESFLEMFKTDNSFLMKKSPGIQTISLFGEDDEDED